MEKASINYAWYEVFTSQSHNSEEHDLKVVLISWLTKTRKHWFCIWTATGIQINKITNIFLHSEHRLLLTVHTCYFLMTSPLQHLCLLETDRLDIYSLYRSQKLAISRTYENTISPQKSTVNLHLLYAENPKFCFRQDSCFGFTHWASCLVNTAKTRHVDCLPHLPHCHCNKQKNTHIINYVMKEMNYVLNISCQCCKFLSLNNIFINSAEWQDECKQWTGKDVEVVMTYFKVPWQYLLGRSEDYSKRISIMTE